MRTLQIRSNTHMSVISCTPLSFIKYDLPTVSGKMLMKFTLPHVYITSKSDQYFLSYANVLIYIHTDSIAIPWHLLRR